MQCEQDENEHFGLIYNLFDTSKSKKNSLIDKHVHQHQAITKVIKKQINFGKKVILNTSILKIQSEIFWFVYATHKKVWHARLIE